MTWLAVRPWPGLEWIRKRRGDFTYCATLAE